MDLTGKYVKHKDLNEAKLLLKRYSEFDVNTKIESLVMNHFSSEIDDSSYSDGLSCRYDNLTVTVCVESPKVYLIHYVIETCDSEYESENDEEPITYLELNIEVLWNSEQNIILVDSCQIGNFKILLEKFKNKPKI